MIAIESTFLECAPDLALSTRNPIPRYNLPMSRSPQQILEEALQLPSDQIDWLVESLLIKEPISDENESEAEIEAAWGTEIKRRLDEIDSGAVEMIPGDQVRAEMISALSPHARARLRA
jgi:hypothetical protein